MPQRKAQSNKSKQEGTYQLASGRSKKLHGENLLRLQKDQSNPPAKHNPAQKRKRLPPRPIPSDPIDISSDDESIDDDEEEAPRASAAEPVKACLLCKSIFAQRLLGHSNDEDVYDRLYNEMDELGWIPEHASKEESREDFLPLCQRCLGAWMRPKHLAKEGPLWVPVINFPRYVDHEVQEIQDHQRRVEAARRGVFQTRAVLPQNDWRDKNGSLYSSQKALSKDNMKMYPFFLSQSFFDELYANKEHSWVETWSAPTAHPVFFYLLSARTCELGTLHHRSIIRCHNGKILPQCRRGAWETPFIYLKVMASMRTRFIENDKTIWELTDAAKKEEAAKKEGVEKKEEAAKKKREAAVTAEKTKRVETIRPQTTMDNVVDETHNSICADVDISKNEETEAPALRRKIRKLEAEVRALTDMVATAREITPQRHRKRKLGEGEVSIRPFKLLVPSSSAGALPTPPLSSPPLSFSSDGVSAGLLSSSSGVSAASSSPFGLDGPSSSFASSPPSSHVRPSSSGPSSSDVRPSASSSSSQAAAGQKCIGSNWIRATYRFGGPKGS